MNGDQTRRQTIRAIGAAAALAVPGCLDGDSPDSTPDKSEENTTERRDGDRLEVLRIDVTGYRFAWEYEYHSGLHSNDYEVDLDETDDDDALVIPRGEPIHLRFSSRDVPHNYGIAGLRMKKDVLPAEQTQLKFRPEEAGVYKAKC
jgi:heme/copper-type cytochrome/quinol oxidase subunit 2